MSIGNRDQGLVGTFGRWRDERSFRRLYRRHTPRLFALAIRLCGSRTRAEDLTQEAWMRAVENHDRFDSRSKYSTWLTGIMINCFREAVRHRARTPTAVDPSSSVVAAFPTRPGPGACAIDVERALTDLPPGYREVVILHDLNGHTHREIAAMLGIQEGSSKSQLKRGRARLRELLTPTEPSPDNREERGTP